MSIKEKVLDYFGCDNWSELYKWMDSQGMYDGRIVDVILRLIRYKKGWELMGTEIVNENGVYVKRFYGGKEEGVKFAVTIDRSFTQAELAVLLGIILKKLIVTGEGT